MGRCFGAGRYWLAGAAVLAAFTLARAQAQQPTPEQLGAIRSSCRSDYMAHCASVKPGGPEALQCLVRNMDRLSGSCRTAVSAVLPKAPESPAPAAAEQSPPPTPSAAPPTAPAASSTVPNPAPAPETAPKAEPRLEAVQKACTMADFTTHCSWIKPDSPEVLRCLEGNAAYLSPNCRAALRGESPPAERAVKPAKREETRSAPASPAPAAAGTPHQPSPQQLDAIRASCRSDFMSHCRGVTPGGAEALQCLQRNAAALSGACRSAVAAIGGGAAGAAPAAPAAAAVPGMPALHIRPFILPRRRLAIMAVCHADVAQLCAGMPAGGGQILECLAAKSASLSPGCYQALARVSEP